MNSPVDYGATIKHIYNKNSTRIPDVNYTRPITSGEIKDRLRRQLTEYNENNPEPPAMRD